MAKYINADDLPILGPSYHYVPQTPLKNPWGTIAVPKTFDHYPLPSIGGMPINVSAPYFPKVTVKDFMRPEWVRVFVQKLAATFETEYRVVYAEYKILWTGIATISDHVLAFTPDMHMPIAQAIRAAADSMVRAYLKATWHGPEPRCCRCNRDAYFREHETIGDNFWCLDHGLKEIHRWKSEPGRFYTVLADGPPYIVLWGAVVGEIVGRRQEREKSRQMSIGDKWEF